MDLKTRYMGLELNNPLVVSASPLTMDLENLRACEAQGAGAVVLRSLFEEQIVNELEGRMDQEDMYYWYPEAAEQIRKISKGQTLRPYLNYIEKARNELSVPVIASINCFSSGSWTSFAREVEKAGAQALELNVATHLPGEAEGSDRGKGGGLMEPEENIRAIIAGVKKQVDIPVSVKIGPYHSNLIAAGRGMEEAGADALVIFNRYYRPDIDIEQLEVTSDSYLSAPEELTHSLRWVGVLSRHLGCDIAANTGIHGFEGIVKQLLAGATVTQFCSVLYIQGMGYIATMLEDLKWWMKQKRFASVEDFRGKIVDDKLNSEKFEQIHFIRKNARLFE